MWILWHHWVEKPSAIISRTHFKSISQSFHFFFIFIFSSFIVDSINKSIYFDMRLFVSRLPFLLFSHLFPSCLFIRFHIIGKLCEMKRTMAHCKLQRWHPSLARLLNRILILFLFALQSTAFVRNKPQWKHRQIASNLHTDWYNLYFVILAGLRMQDTNLSRFSKKKRGRNNVHLKRSTARNVPGIFIFYSFRFNKSICESHTHTHILNPIYLSEQSKFALWIHFALIISTFYTHTHTSSTLTNHRMNCINIFMNRLHVVCHFQASSRNKPTTCEEAKRQQKNQMQKKSAVIEEKLE